MIVNVILENREDGGIRVYSDELPGLILSGRDRTKVIADIEPAVRALLERRGVEFKSLRIDATLPSTVRHIDCPCEDGKCIFPKCTCALSPADGGGK